MSAGVREQYLQAMGIPVWRQRGEKPEPAADTAAGWLAVIPGYQQLDKRARRLLIDVLHTLGLDIDAISVSDSAAGAAQFGCLLDFSGAGAAGDAAGDATVFSLPSLSAPWTAADKRNVWVSLKQGLADLG